MNFEEIAPAPPSSPAAMGPACRFSLERGPWAGQTFVARLRVCPNPCCPCSVVGLWCRRADVPGEKTLAFDLDFFARQLNTKVQSAPGAVALGRAFLAEAQEAHWEWFDRLVRAVKRRQMENLDLDTLAEDLPPDLKVGGGVLTGYAEVFPWVDPFTFACDGADWFVDDQYCMEPGCGCTQAGLTFFRAPAALTTPRAPFAVMPFSTSITARTKPKSWRPDPADRVPRRSCTLCAQRAPTSPRCSAVATGGCGNWGVGSSQGPDAGPGQGGRSPRATGLNWRTHLRPRPLLSPVRRRKSAATIPVRAAAARSSRNAAVRADPRHFD